MNGLYTKLIEEIRLNRAAIQRIISNFEKSGSSYKNAQIALDLLLILRNNGTEKLMAVGFPFPLECYPLTMFRSKKHTSIFIYLRGEPVRQAQRDSLLNDLRDIRELNYIEVASIDEFRRITKGLCDKYKLADYFDPYSYKGDSLIGIHFIENFSRAYALKINTIHSDNYKDLDCVSPSQGYIAGVSKRKDVLNVFADLLDNQHSRTSLNVCRLAARGIPSVIIGRDLIVMPEKAMIRVYHFIREEVLLKSDNIEDYMNSCLLPFLNPMRNKSKCIKISSENIMINPFGSESNKTVPLPLIVYVIKYLNKHYSRSKIFFISGFQDSYPHIIYLSKLQGMISKERLSNVMVVNYGSFSELVSDIKRHNIALGLTADTSIAHLFNFLGLRNATFYNIERCDLESPQSLSSDGPLGFCRYGPIQYPAIMNRDDDMLAKGVTGWIDYFFARSKDRKWCSRIYDDKLLTSKIGSRNAKLMQVNQKISPSYKVKND
jgi:hypothetical protein